MIYPPLVWLCPDCRRVVKTFVRPSEAPTCQNPDVHTSKQVVMRLKKGEEGDEQ
jgi:hypothetical protein